MGESGGVGGVFAGQIRQSLDVAGDGGATITPGELSELRSSIVKGAAIGGVLAGQIRAALDSNAELPDSTRTQLEALEKMASDAGAKSAELASKAADNHTGTAVMYGATAGLAIGALGGPVGAVLGAGVGGGTALVTSLILRATR